MQFMLGTAVVLAIAGVVFVLVALAYPGRPRIIFGLLGFTALAMTLSIWALLRFAEPTVCVKLGGESKRNGPNLVCRNEWGGSD